MALAIGTEVIEGRVDFVGFVKLVGSLRPANSSESTHIHELFVSLGVVFKGKASAAKKAKAQKIIKELSETKAATQNLSKIIDPSTGDVKKDVSWDTLKESINSALFDWTKTHLALATVASMAMVGGIYTLHDLDNRTTVAAKTAKKCLERAKTCLLNDVLPYLHETSTDCHLQLAEKGLKFCKQFTDDAKEAVDTATTSAGYLKFWGTALAVIGGVGASVFAPLAVSGAIAMSAGEAVGWVVGADIVTTLLSGSVAAGGIRGVVRAVKHKDDLEKLGKELEEHMQNWEESKRIFHRIRSRPAIEA